MERKKEKKTEEGGIGTLIGLGLAALVGGAIVYFGSKIAEKETVSTPSTTSNNIISK